MAQDIEEGTVKYLAETLQLEQVGYRDWVTARGPDNKRAGILRADALTRRYLRSSVSVLIRIRRPCE